MRIDEETVRRIEALSRLELSAEERRAMVADLSRILDYVAQLAELDTQGVAPTAHALTFAHSLREDAARPSLPPETGLGQAPETGEGCFRVPRVLGGEEEAGGA